MRDFYNFVQERQRVQYRKESGMPWPWTTNAYVRDMVLPCVRWQDNPLAKWLRDEVYLPVRDPKITLFNACVHRAFNTKEFTLQSGRFDAWDPRTVEKWAADRISSGMHAFDLRGLTGAVKGKSREWVVCHVVLSSIWDRLAEFSETWSLKSLETALRDVPQSGRSFAAQVVNDMLMLGSEFWGAEPEDLYDYAPTTSPAMRAASRILCLGERRLPDQRKIDEIGSQQRIHMDLPILSRTDVVWQLHTYWSILEIEEGNRGHGALYQ